MNRCVNINHPEFKELLNQSSLDPISLAADVSIWQDRNDTDIFPTLEQLVPPVEKVEYRFAAVDKILAKLPILNKWWKDKGISKDTFWKKFKELGIPQEQVELYKESEGDTFEEVVIDTLAKYSFDVEVNTSFLNEVEQIGEVDKVKFNRRVKELADKKVPLDKRAEILEREFPIRRKKSNYYDNLTVPGGINYEENEIKTPQITPSIKGHASFSTDSGAGWFRSDTSNSDTKVRRVLELQSDLFQKGRTDEYLVNVDDRKLLIFSTDYAQYFVYPTLIVIKHENGFKEEINPRDLGGREDEQLIKDEIEEYKKDSNLNKKENKFLQLLNKDGNWVKFFVQSIVQQSKKAVVYEKSLPDIEEKIVSLRKQGLLKIECK